MFAIVELRTNTAPEKNRRRTKDKLLSTSGKWQKMTTMHNYAWLCDLLRWYAGWSPIGRQKDIFHNSLILWNFWGTLFRQFAGSRYLSPSDREQLAGYKQFINIFCGHISQSVLIKPKSLETGEIQVWSSVPFDDGSILEPSSGKVLLAARSRSALCAARGARCCHPMREGTWQF